MMLIQIVILGALAAMAGASRTYDVGDWVNQFAGIASRVDYKLKEAGMSSSATNEEIYQILKGINPSAGQYPVSGIYTQFFDVDFAMRLGEILEGKMKIDCRDIYFNGVSELYHSIKTSHVSGPLERYITDAYKKVSQFCTGELSANDWQKFDEGLRLFFKTDQAAVVGELLEGKCDPDDINKDDFWIQFSPRLKAMAKEKNIYVSDVFSIMDRVTSEAQIMLKNMGETVAFDELNQKLKCVYTTLMITQKLESDAHTIKHLPGIFPFRWEMSGRRRHMVIPALSFFEGLAYYNQDTDDINRSIVQYAKAMKLSVGDVKKKIADKCALVKVDASTLALAKTGLRSTGYMSGRFVAQICYDAKKAAIIS